MPYIDGFVIPVPNDKKDAYIEASKTYSAIAKEFGAVSVREFWGDDVPEGTTTSFSMAVKLEASESVVFSWVEWPDKATRDTGSAKMREDPRMANMNMPFDGKRLIYGGFDLLTES
ncbi:DUF1428 domain-containing protein [Asticcacaulis solisilvae]|uniref:DUF1428 domain-containing protein n=1 Tax=Asticcacaulis solisilvae TaxID=1217274 RepID=UPI003FD8FAFB